MSAWRNLRPFRKFDIDFSIQDNYLSIDKCVSRIGASSALLVHGTPSDFQE
jgi:hypothetical protein